MRDYNINCYLIISYNQNKVTIQIHSHGKIKVYRLKKPFFKKPNLKQESQRAIKLCNFRDTC